MAPPLCFLWLVFEAMSEDVKPFGLNDDDSDEDVGESASLYSKTSASVAAAMDGIAELKLDADVVGVVALAENAIGSKALRPLEVLQSKQGTE